MYYIVSSEDIFVRPHSNNKTTTTESSGSSASSSNKWSQWVESPTTGWSKNIDEETKKSMEEEARKLLSN
jgi:paired amphipathic helix protein Sin3a